VRPEGTDSRRDGVEPVLRIGATYMDHDRFPRVRSLVPAAAGWMILFGCQTPQPNRTRTGEAVGTAGTIIRLDTQDPQYLPALQWRAGCGRMGPYLCRRHGFSPARIGQVVLEEDFEQTEAGGRSGWRTVGRPRLRWPRAAEGTGGSGRYLELGWPRDEGAHGLAWDLPAARLAGRTVRCRIRTYHPRLLRQPDRTMPVVRFVFHLPDGTKQIVPWPLVARPSPGWETQRFLCAAPDRIRSAALEILQTSSGAIVGFDDLRIGSFDPRRRRARTAVGEPGGNLVIDGDFELGQKGFSVVGIRTVPGRGRMIVPHLWSFDADRQAPVHRTALLVPLERDPVQVEFACLRAPPTTTGLVLGVWLRASRRVRVQASLTGPEGQLASASFLASERWEHFEKPLPLSGPAGELAGLVLQAEPVAPEAEASKPTYLWMDGVALYAGSPAAAFRGPKEVAIGIVGPARNPVDLAHLIDAGQPVSFTVRCVNYGPDNFRGTAAIDVVDGLDRPVWTITTRLSVRPDGPYARSYQLRLPRGYYRILATLWPGKVGRARPIARAERAFGLIDLDDPVPIGSPFGFAADIGRLSARLTQIGGGWVRFMVEPPPGPKPTLDWLGEVLQSAGRAKLESVAAIHMVPRDESAKRYFIGTLVRAAAANKAVVEIAALDDPELRAVEYLEFFNRCAGDITRLARQIPIVAPSRAEPLGAGFRWLRECLKYALASSTAAVTVRMPPVQPPEQAEPALEALASLAVRKGLNRCWDVRVPARAGSAYQTRQSERTPMLAGTIRPADGDPTLDASRLVRSLLIRFLAGTERIGCGLFAYEPIRILHAASPETLNEYDNAPKPALVAFDFLAEMLNDARLIEWIDLAGDVRALCFQRADGRGVVAIWRPFGMSLEWYVLAGWGSKARLVNCFGQPEPAAGTDGALRIPVNAIVRYVLVDAENRSALFRALRTASPLGTSPASTPPAPPARP